MKENKTLISLDFSFNEISDVGAQAIVLALKENKTLTELKYYKYYANIEGCGGYE